MNQWNELPSSLFGYNKQAVSQLVSQQNQKIEELTKQLETMTQQVATLEDSLSHYYEIEEALKTSVIDARITGDKIVEESHDAAERIREQTEEQMEQYKEEITHRSETLVQRGVDLRVQLETMRESMLSTLKEYETFVKNTTFDQLFPEKDINSMTKLVTEFDTDTVLQKPQGELAGMGLSPDSSLTEEEKKELAKLIQEVIANESRSANETKASHLSVVNRD